MSKTLPYLVIALHVAYSLYQTITTDVSNYQQWHILFLHRSHKQDDSATITTQHPVYNFDIGAYIYIPKHAYT